MTRSSPQPPFLPVLRKKKKRRLSNQGRFPVIFVNQLEMIGIQNKIKDANERPTRVIATVVVIEAATKKTIPSLAMVGNIFRLT